MALASLLGARENLEVVLWGRTPRLDGRGVVTSRGPDGALLSRGLVRAEPQPEQAADGAAIVILTVPTHARRQLLAALAPQLGRCVLLLSWEGTGHFAGELATCGLDPAIGAGLQRSPLIARHTRRPGSVAMLGVRSSVVAGAIAASERRRILALLHALFPFAFRMAPSYEHVVLSPGNPLIHPARLFSWQPARRRRAERFYADWDDRASAVLLALHAELAGLRDQLGLSRRHIVTLKERRPRLSDAQLTAEIRAETRLGAVPMPLRQSAAGPAPDPAHRFIREDIGEGLAQIVALARAQGVAMPTAEAIVAWGRNLAAGKQGR